MRTYMEVRMEALSTRQFRKSSFVRGIMPVMAVALALLVVGACSSQPAGSARSRSAESVLVDGANDLGLDIGPRNDTYAAAMGEGKKEKELEKLMGGGAEAGAEHGGKKIPGPDDWRIITNSLSLFRHAPYVTDLVLGLLCSIGVALALTGAPRRAVRFDPIAHAENRRATVICALIGCIAAELVQASEHFLMGAEIALVLFGIGGLVRFRTIFSDAGQTGVAIVATVLGLACGMSEYSLVALSLVIVFLAMWLMSSVAHVHLRIKVRKHADLAQVQSAVTSILQDQHFSVLRCTPSTPERTIEIYARTTADFDSEALAHTIVGIVPGARVRIKAS